MGCPRRRARQADADARTCTYSGGNAARNAAAPELDQGAARTRAPSIDKALKIIEESCQQRGPAHIDSEVPSVLSPHWPESLGALGFPIHYRGHHLHVRISGEGAEVSVDPRDMPPVVIECRGRVEQLEPGCTIRFPESI